jgi:hypothetical protein
VAEARGGGNMETADQLMLTLKQALERSYEWLSQFNGLQSQHQHSLLSTKDIEDDMRTRASSSLLTLTFLAEFSSGKSFLASGFQKCLQLEKLRGGSGLFDKYVGD